jgi:hypothetical protein
MIELYDEIKEKFSNFINKNEKVQLNNIQGLTIEETFDLLNTFIGNIDELINDYKADMVTEGPKIKYNYYLNLRLFVNNMILIMCYYISQTSHINESYCSDNSYIDKEKIYDYFLNEKDISELETN